MSHWPNLTTLADPLLCSSRYMIVYCFDRNLQVSIQRKLEFYSECRHRKYCYKARKSSWTCYTGG